MKQCTLYPSKLADTQHVPHAGFSVADRDRPKGRVADCYSSLAGKQNTGEDTHTLSPAQIRQAEMVLLHRASWGQMSQAQM